MENKSKKISLGTAICLVIVLILVTIAALEYYLGIVKKNEEIKTLKEEKAELENYRKEIAGTINNIQTEYSNKLEEINKEEKTIQNNTSELSVLNNANNIKIFNVGTGINPVLFIITNDGRVYETQTNNLDFNLNKALKNYKVEDILSKTGELSNVFEVLLKDGTKTTITEDLGI